MAAAANTEKLLTSPASLSGSKAEEPAINGDDENSSANSDIIDTPPQTVDTACHAMATPTHGMDTPTHGMDTPTHGIDTPSSADDAPSYEGSSADCDNTPCPDSDIPSCSAVPVHTPSPADKAPTTDKKSEAAGTSTLTPGAESAEMPSIDLIGSLTDVGGFSLCAICACELHKLYNKDYDREYKKCFMQDLIVHTKQSKQVEKTILAIVDGEGVEDADVFVKILCEEDVLVEHGVFCVVADLVSFALVKGTYDARTRVLIRRVSSLLDVPWLDVRKYEVDIVTKVKQQVHQLTEEEQKERDDKQLKRKIKRYALIGLATIGGGTLIGLTGGLAAPLLAPILVPTAAAIVGASSAAVLTSTAVIASLFGAAGAGLGGYKMKKRVGDIEEFGFKAINDGDDLHVTIAVTGWLTEDDNDICAPWVCMDSSTEQYSLLFDTEHITEMGHGINYLVNAAVTSAASQALKYTVLSSVMAAIMWPAALIGAAGVIDNPWSVCTHRTENAGKQLAEVLLSRTQGCRPVTLVGFSLGSRVIFYCLKELARRKNSLGIVESAVMLGSPVPGSSKEWRPLERVVAGRIVNGYCSDDWLLKFLYRTASVQFSIAGLRPIEWQDPKMVNVDLTNIVTGHLDYKHKLPLILEMVGVPTKDYKCDVINTEDDCDWLVIHEEDVNHTPSQSSHSIANSDQSDAPIITHEYVDEAVDCMELVSSGDGTKSKVPNSLSLDRLTISRSSSGSILSRSTTQTLTPDRVLSSHSSASSLVNGSESGFASGTSSSVPSPSRHKALLDITADNVNKKPKKP